MSNATKSGKVSHMKPGKQTRAKRLEAIWEEARRLGVVDFRGEVIEFVKRRIPAEPTSPRKRTWGYSFGLDKGGPVYVNVSLDWDRLRPQCCITFNSLAVDAIGDVMISSLKRSFSDQHFTYKDSSLKFSLPKDKWAGMKPPLEQALEKMVEGWK